MLNAILRLLTYRLLAVASMKALSR